MRATPEDLTQDEHIERVSHLLAERRKQNLPVAQERRGRNPQRRGYESDQDDIAFAFVADRALDEKDD